MIKAIFTVDYNKHHFAIEIARAFNLKINFTCYAKGDFMIFDNTDNAKEVHRKICGYYNPIRDGEIQIYRVEQNFNQPIKLIPFTKEETNIWLNMYYFGYEETYLMQEKCKEISAR